MTKVYKRVSFHGYTLDDAYKNGREGVQKYLDDGYKVDAQWFYAHDIDFVDDHQSVYILYREEGM